MRVLGPFYSGEVLPPSLAEQTSYPCRASFLSLQSKPLILVKQASHPCRTSFLKHGGQVWAFVLSGAHVKGWALPSLGLWIWAYWARQWAHWAYQALSHILPSSAAPFTPFDPSPSCRRSIGVTVKTNNNDGPCLWR